MTASIGLGTVGLVSSSAASRIADSRITILLNEPIGTIDPNLYSHSVGDLRGGADKGICVGANSTIENINGFRRDFCESLAKISPGTIGYTGRCVAGSINLSDNTEILADIEPKATSQDTAHRLNRLAFAQNDVDSFSLNQFITLCRLVSARPRLEVNLRNLNPQDFLDWAEFYRLADNRPGAVKSSLPHVQYWNITNEIWGSGGDLLPEDHADVFQGFAEKLSPSKTILRLSCSVPNGGSTEWTRRFLSRLLKKSPSPADVLDSWAIRYCCGTTGEGVANEFNENEWYELLRRSEEIESVIKGYWSCLGEFDPSHRVKLVVNEWGAWHQRQNDLLTYPNAYSATLRDALVSAIHLDTFQRHADKVKLAAPAHLINSAHSLFLARGQEFLLTPNYYVYEMYKSHSGSKALRIEIDVPSISFTFNEISKRLSGLCGSASINGKIATLTIVNPDIRQPRETEIRVNGGKIVSGKARVLTSTNIQSQNSFCSPRELEPRNENLSVRKNGGLVYRFLPASVTTLKFIVS